MVGDHAIQFHIVFTRCQEIRYPRPSWFIYDNGEELTRCDFQELLNSYAIRLVPTIVKNPQANAFTERVHLTIDDMLCNEYFILDPSNSRRDEVDNVLQRLA